MLYLKISVTFKSRVPIKSLMMICQYRLNQFDLENPEKVFFQGIMIKYIIKIISFPKS